MSSSSVTHVSVLSAMCSVHAAVIAINEAVERGCVRDTAQALRNPNAMLTNLQEQLMAVYQEMLRQARSEKAAQAYVKVGQDGTLNILCYRF